MLSRFDVSLGFCIMLTAFAAFILYRTHQFRHARLVNGLVKNYLMTRYGELPSALSIDCSDDRLWPILVKFDHPNPETRHRLEFMCPGSKSTFKLVKEEPQTSLS